MRKSILFLATASALCLAATTLAAKRDLKAVALPKAPTQAAGDTGKIILLRDNESRVEVDADGKVVSVQSDPALPAPVAEALAQNIRKIAFAPPMKDGVAVPGVTYVFQDACAAPVDGAYRLAVKLQGNGPSLVQRYAPRYPADALRGHEGAVYQVEYDVAPDGSVALHAATALSGAHRFKSQFEQAIKSWVEAQTFRPEQLGGAPVGTRIGTRVEFTLAGGPPRRKRPDADAKDATCQVALAAPPAPDQRVAMTSPFHPLATD